MKKLFALLIVSAMLLTSILALASCSGTPSGEKSYVSVDINPEVELVVEDGKVVSFRAANEDAQVMLYEEASLVGTDVEEAVEKITSLAIEFGYLDESNTVVGLSVTANKGADKLEGELEGAVEEAAKSADFQLKVDTGASYSVERRLEALKAQYPDNEVIQNLDAPKFKLALSASEDGSISLEAAVEMDVDALIARVNAEHEQMEIFATEAFIQARKLSTAAYDKAVGLAEDIVYYQYLIKEIATNPSPTIYATGYYMDMICARGLTQLADIFVFIEKISVKPLTDEQIAAVMTALGLAEGESGVLENYYGDITVRSVEAYADKLFKNMAEGAELDAKKQALTEALAGAESALKQLADKELAENLPAITAVIEAGGSGFDTVSSLINLNPLVSEEAKTALTTVMNDYKQISEELTALIEDGSFDSYDIRAIADKLMAKGEENKVKAENLLTDDQKTEIADQQKAAVDKLTAEKAALDSAIDKAEAEAKAHIEELRRARLEKLGATE